MALPEKAPSGRQIFAFKEHLKGVFLGSEERFAPVDGMRAITMLNVVLFHTLFGFTKVYDEAKNYVFVDNLPGYLNWVWQVRGSDCLFLVSGFLMGITLIREYQKNESIHVMRFYKRRMMRKTRNQLAVIKFPLNPKCPTVKTLVVFLFLGNDMKHQT